MSERDAAWAAYQATRGKPAAEQDAARRRYDAAVRAEEQREGLDCIMGTRDRMIAARRAAQPARPPVKRDAWGYPVDDNDSSEGS